MKFSINMRLPVQVSYHIYNNQRVFENVFGGLVLQPVLIQSLRYVFSEHGRLSKSCESVSWKTQQLWNASELGETARCFVFGGC